MFDEESVVIKQALDSQYIDIHHIGSTSVPGLDSKDKIDIIGVVKNGKESINLLEKAGYTYKGEWNIPCKYGFTKRGKINVNLHVYEKNHPEIESNIKFRDYLRNNSDMRNKYTALKHEILEDTSAMEYSDSGFLRKYTLRKGDLIRDILSKAGFNRLRIIKVMDKTEWDAVEYFRNKYFFVPNNIDDPYRWTFNNKDHQHLVLYQGIEIIGYAHIQFWPDNRAVIRIIVIDENKQSQGYGNKFLVLIEQWLRHLDIKTIHAESRQSSLKFYLNNGYVAMPFNDPGGHEDNLQDISVGKML